MPLIARTTVFLALVSGAAAARVAQAQPRAGAAVVLRGFVVDDSTEAPIAGGTVEIPSVGIGVTTGANGAYRLTGMSPGTYLVHVRAIGMQAITARLRFAAGDSLERDFGLLRMPVSLAGVTIRGSSDASNSKLAAFERRRDAGIGNFITTATLDSMSTRRLAEILATRLPATIVTRTSTAWVAARRGTQSILRKQQLDRFDVAKGADRSACYAAVYLDGALVYGGNPGETLFDVNSLQPAAVAGVEYYSGGAQVPIELNATLNTCGVLVIWTR